MTKGWIANKQKKKKTDTNAWITMHMNLHYIPDKTTNYKLFHNIHSHEFNPSFENILF